MNHNSRHCRLAFLALTVAVALAPAATVAGQSGAAPVSRPDDARRQAVRQFFVAQRAAASGDKAAALTALEGVAAAKRGFYPGRQNPLSRYLTDPAFAAVRKALLSSFQQTARGKLAYRVSARRLMPEGIAYDPRRNRLLLSDWRSATIYSVRRGHVPAPLFSLTDLKPNGLAVDQHRDVLWLAATNAFSGAESPRSELVRVDLATGRRSIFVSPDGKGFNDVAVAPNGDVYISDTTANRIFRLRSGAKVLESVLDAGSGMNSPNGLAIDPSGQYLFVAQGLTPMRLRLSDGDMTLLNLPPDLDMIGTDGFYFRGRSLYGVQNLLTPGRVVKLDLNRALDTVTRYSVLDSGHPAFDLPTTGTFIGNRFLVIANSQIYKLANGKLPSSAKVDPLLILEYPAGR